MSKKTWGYMLRVARERRSLTVKEAAALHGVTSSCWGYWEADTNVPHGRNLRPLMQKWPDVLEPGDIKSGMVPLGGWG